jgi:hypothetical protein
VDAQNFRGLAYTLFLLHLSPLKLAPLLNTALSTIFSLPKNISKKSDNVDNVNLKKHKTESVLCTIINILLSFL